MDYRASIFFKSFAACAFALFAGALCSGCKGDEKSNGTPGSKDTDTSTLPGDSDTTATDSQTEEDPDAWIETYDAPAQWATGGNCGTIGVSCVNFGGCEEDTICQTEGWVCIPNPLEEGRSRGPEYPYCMSYTCMSYEEASCYCAGEGATLYPTACAAGPQAILGKCAMEKGSCTEKACCGDLECVEISPAQSSCQKKCETADDCETGCCTDLWGTGVLVCAAMSECENPCLPIGGDCEATSECCQGTCVTSTNPDSAGCRQVCNESWECATGCCRLFSGETYGFCASASQCACTPNEEQCAPDGTVISCCDSDYKCSSLPGDEAGYRCHPKCADNADCDSNCCLLFENREDGICGEASRCACTPAGELCMPDGNPVKCCDSDFICAGPAADYNSYRCTARCEQHSDCITNCCVLFTDETYGICKDSSSCS